MITVGHIGRPRKIIALAEFASISPEYQRAYRRLKGAIPRTISKYIDYHPQVVRTLHNINLRCNYAGTHHYSNYGGKGIKNFLTLDDLQFLWDRDGAANMKRPSIDRKNTADNYTLENSQWIEFLANIKKAIHPHKDLEIRKQESIARAWKHCPAYVKDALVLAQQKGLPAKLYTRTYRPNNPFFKTSNKTLEINGYTCTTSFISKARSSGLYSTALYSHVTLSRRYDIRLIFRLNNGNRELFIIPNTILPESNKIYIPLIHQQSYDKYRGGRPPKTDWFRFQDAWHLLFTSKNSINP